MLPDHQLKSELFDEFARIGKALGSGRRIEIIDLLANGERTVEALAEQVGMSIANTSQHLQVLREAGLVSNRRNGTYIHYRLASPRVFDLWSMLRTLASERLAVIDRLVRDYVGDSHDLEPVSRDELLRRLHAGEPLVVLDVRPVEEYEAGHLPGAVSIPLPELERRLRELPKRRQIIAYCRGPYCALAPHAIQALRARGYRARQLEDGFPEWAAAGLPTEQG